ncbi:cytochrome P450 [Pseudonocardiaceae bacterium YIM PH 21723]|nr:cytochrome P450 [Pseudonocardiaceae bacterium YIM PH 21723]
MSPNLPPGPRWPLAVQGAYMVFDRRGLFHRMRATHGKAFTLNLPSFGRTVMISERDQIKQLFSASPDAVGNVQPNLGRMLGKHSMFAMEGKQHRTERKLLVPPFHGKRLAVYEEIARDEALKEFATWPVGTPFPTMPSTMRITLNIILRAVFGAEGTEFDELREVLPPFVELASRLQPLPFEASWGPWRRLARLRERYERIVDRLIDKATDLDGRDDVLAMLLQARYEDGSSMSRQAIYDELVTLLAAGHETTANTLAWTVDRLRRHPELLAELAGGENTELLAATILEAQRSRSVIDITGRRVLADEYELGPWRIPKGTTMLVGIDLIHTDPDVFPDPDRFDPNRFLGTKADLYQWIPYGGGSRRCIGAAFAQMEMNVVLRTLLQEIVLEPTSEPDERFHGRGIAYSPAKGGLAIVHPRSRAITQKL